jgi:fucose permease
VSGPARSAVVLSFLAFVSLGLPDGSLGVAWPSLRAVVGVELSALGTMLAVSMAGTLVSSAASGMLLERLGVGRVLIWSTLLVTTSAALLASVRSWPWALASALLGGLGAGAVDAGVNTWAATSFSPRAMTWLHATYGAGAMLGPLVLTLALGLGLGFRMGYAVLAALLLTLAVAFARYRSLWSTTPPRAAVPPLRDEVAPPPPPGTWRTTSTGPPRIALGVFLFFVYTGLEAACGQWSYTFLTEGGALGPQAAGMAVAGYWGALGGGRVAFGALAGRFPSPTLVRAGVLGALVSGIALALLPGPAAALFLLLMGFALAPVYPLSVSETPRRVGALRAARVIGWQVSGAYLGVAFWPYLGGVLAERLGVSVLGSYLAALALIVFLVSEALRTPPGVEPVPAGSRPGGVP